MPAEPRPKRGHQILAREPHEDLVDYAQPLIREKRETLARIEELADKCTEDRLSAAERAEYEAYVSAIDFVGVLQAKARRLLAGTAGT